MGKFLKKLEGIRETKDFIIVERFKKIVVAQAMRAFTGIKKDVNLDMEVRLTGEEIERRMGIKKR